jgi:glycosyltransferase involved in cell wall biosynthesis
MTTGIPGPRVLSVSYGRHLFVEGDPERARLARCSEHVAEHHMIVFALARHGLAPSRAGERFTLHPTRSRTRAGMLVDAVRIGTSIVRAAPRGTRWCISAQDPLAAGLAGWLVHALTGQPLLIQEHGDIFAGGHWRAESRANRRWYGIARFLIRRADRVRVVADRVRAHVRALGVPDERIVQLPVLTDVRAFAGRAPAVDLRALHPRASLVVLSVARFVPQKNLALLVRAFARLQREDPRAVLVLVGQGEEESALRAEIARHALGASVTLMPWSADVASLMKTADVYALSSNYEGWARVLIEAMACGLPAVTTDVGCVGQVFLDGEHGRVVPVGDEAAFADALLLLAKDPAARAAMSARGPAAAARLFQDVDAYAEAWAACFRGLGPPLP